MQLINKSIIADFVLYNLTTHKFISQSFSLINFLLNLRLRIRLLYSHMFSNHLFQNVLIHAVSCEFWLLQRRRYFA